MQKLYEITIPDLSAKADFPAVRHRLLADFPQVVEVLAMTTPSTVLIVYRGEDEADAWLDALSDSVAARRKRVRQGPACSDADTSSANRLRRSRRSRRAPEVA